MTVTSPKPDLYPQVSAWSKWAPLAVVMCGTFVFILDIFVVNVALPSIQHSLGAGPGAIEWVVAGYGLTMAAFLVFGGRLGDRYGRRLWFSAGLALFVASSVLCAVAPDPAFLIAARLAQGLGAVAERAIGVEGPIREYYMVGWAHSQDEREHRTEVCWPVFRTAGE